MCRFVVIHQTTAVGFLSELSWTLLYFSFSSSWNCSSSSFSSFSSFSSYFFFSLSFFLSFFLSCLCGPVGRNRIFWLFDVTCAVFWRRTLFVYFMLHTWCLSFTGVVSPPPRFPFLECAGNGNPVFPWPLYCFQKRVRRRRSWEQDQTRSRSNRKMIDWITRLSGSDLVIQSGRMATAVGLYRVRWETGGSSSLISGLGVTTSDWLGQSRPIMDEYKPIVGKALDSRQWRYADSQMARNCLTLNTINSCW